jgi:hypothetical protein
MKLHEANGIYKYTNANKIFNTTNALDVLPDATLSGNRPRDL